MKEMDTDRGMGFTSGETADRIRLDFAGPDMDEMFAFKFPCGYTGRELDGQSMNSCVLCAFALSPLALLPILEPIPVVGYCTDYFIHQTEKVPTSGMLKNKRKSFNQWMKE